MLENLKAKIEAQPKIVKIVAVVAGVAIGAGIALVVVSALNADAIEDIVEHIDETGQIVAEQNPF
jgi:hypothetical protein